MAMMKGTSMESMTEDRPWTLAIFSLGSFRVFCKGKPLRFPGRVHRKPLAMLKVIVDNGGRNVPVGPVMDALWPETDGDRAHKSFATTLHRLRKLIGAAKAIRHHDTKVSLDDDYCWVDIWELETLLEDAETEWEKAREKARGGGGPAKAVELTERVIGMFKGPMIPGETADPWETPFLKGLRGRFVRSVGHLGRHREHIGQWDKAITCYQRGLEADEFSEDLCYCLMICYQRNDRVAEALAAYGRFREVLHATFGIEPSSRLKTLARDLRRSRLPTLPRRQSPV
jgi:DNA-binding SARP family transcriptional activator